MGLPLFGPFRIRVGIIQRLNGFHPFLRFLAVALNCCISNPRLHSFHRSAWIRRVLGRFGIENRDSIDHSLHRNSTETLIITWDEKDLGPTKDRPNVVGERNPFNVSTQGERSGHISIIRANAQELAIRHTPGEF
jgi:hypothetical protein